MNTGRVTTDLVTFLRARLDEDKAGAWRAEQGWPFDVGIDSDWGEVPTEQREHVRRWDPARVLAEVDAKRRVVDRAEEWLRTAGWDTGEKHSLRLLRDHYTATLQDLALPYASHPDYEAAWRP